MPDLEISEPDLGVKDGEREDVVDERLGSPGLRRHTKYLFDDNNEHLCPRVRSRGGTHMCEQLFRQSPPFRLFKRGIKAQDPATALETIPCHLELVHRVHVLYVQLDARPVRCLGRPEIQVLMPPRFKVERVVARVQIREFR